jgi:hypothetical protein
VSWPARAVFVLLVGATFAAFFTAQRLKGSAPVVLLRGVVRDFSPNGDGRRDVNTFRVRLQKRDDVAVAIVDERGDVVRRLAEDVRIEPERPLDLSWDGRTDDGLRAPDGPYRVRVNLFRQARSVTVAKTITVDTEPPSPHVRAIAPAQLAEPGGGPFTVRVASIGERSPTRFEVVRTDVSPPRTVATTGERRRGREWTWNGRVDGDAAPAGTYLVRAGARDRAGNLGWTPARMPPPPGERVRGNAGLTIRALAAEAPVRPITAGRRIVVNVDSRRRPYAWRLRRAGRVNPVARGREDGGAPVRVKAPAGPSGLYLLELRVGRHRTTAPILVQSADRADVLVVVPAMTWLGLDRVDEDRDGMPDTLAGRRAVSWPRVLSGLPAVLAEETAPLLVFLDRAHVRYDLTSDLDLALSRSPRATDREGVLLAGPQRWVPRAYAQRLRRYVLDGGRVASFGTESLRRGVRILRNGPARRGRLVRPTEPSDRDPFGTRFEGIRRFEEPTALDVLSGAADPLFTGFVGPLEGFGAIEESAPPVGERTRLEAALGVPPAPGEDPRPGLAGTRFGDGLVIRVGLAGWEQRLDDPEVAQLTRNVFDLLRGAEPKIRSTG